ncbi:MAG TPA: hypothetical protein VMA77_22715 [Solirubrobacteraceae bacterium]|nr:hypothetical protein [Solirubrobacteraceae bacterium]
MTTTTTLAIRELDHRHGDGIDVRLLWNPRTNQVSVTVEDERLGETFVLDVPGPDARQAFTHPYAYAQRGRFESLLAA